MQQKPSSKRVEGRAEAGKVAVRVSITGRQVKAAGALDRLPPGL